jgi:hypothetical protein
LTVRIITQGGRNGQLAGTALLRPFGTRYWGRTHHGNLLPLYTTTQFRQQIAVFTLFPGRGFASVLTSIGIRYGCFCFIGGGNIFKPARRDAVRAAGSGLGGGSTGLSGLLFFVLVTFALRFGFSDLTLFIRAAAVRILTALTQFGLSHLLLATALFLFPGPV